MKYKMYELVLWIFWKSIYAYKSAYNMNILKNNQNKANIDD